MMNPASVLTAWKDVVIRRIRSIPSWVIVLATAAVVGSISASASVIGLARLRNQQSALEVPGGSDE